MVFSFKKKTIKQTTVARQYQHIPSLADQLPWLEWSDQKAMMLLEDGRSVGAAVEIRDTPTEAMPDHWLVQLHMKLQHTFAKVLPLEDENPWVLQLYFQDEETLDPLYDRLAQYIHDQGLAQDKLSQTYLKLMKTHFNLLARPQGLFVDPLSKLPFRGRMRRVRAVLYRRYTNSGNISPENCVAELETTLQAFTQSLRQLGLETRRLDGAALYDWWVRWFQPKTGALFLEKFPYPTTKTKPFGWQFADQVFHQAPETQDGCWLFEGVKHQLLLLKDLHTTPEIGVISRERRFGAEGKESYALFDKFPPGSIYVMTLVFESKRRILDHLHRIEKAAIGHGQVIHTILENVKRARDELDAGNPLIRASEAVYIREAPDQPLARIESSLRTLLNDVGLDTYAQRDQLFPTDTYLRFLPFNFNAAFDAKYTQSGTYQYASDIASLLPVYGRSRGDGWHPLFCFYNRAGQPFIFDNLNKTFKRSNSHLMIVGTTGAGKSVTLNNLITSLSAVHHPHIMVLEVGGSFDLTTRYLAAHGRTVRQLKFDLAAPIPVNPYAEWHRAFAQLQAEGQMIVDDVCTRSDKPVRTDVDTVLIDRHAEQLADEIAHCHDHASEAEQTADANRDCFNEMLLATRVMITQGQHQEEAKLDLTDMTLINRGLMHAMRVCHTKRITQMRIVDVMEAFKHLADNESVSRLKGRYREFALRLEFYIQDNTRRQFLNQFADPLATYDYLQVDFGFMQQDRYHDMLNITCIAILSNILALAEANKASGRPTVLILDEAHVFFKSEMVATFIILMAKVARKLGLIIIPCTQNIGDFQGVESRKVLSMMETWLCLSLDREEMTLLEQFKPLTEEMRCLIADIEKNREYSEGVLLAKRRGYSGLFRNVPPRLMLALAQTEQDERTAREQLRKEKGFSELEAVEHIAQALETRPVRPMSGEAFL